MSENKFDASIKIRIRTSALLRLDMVDEFFRILAPLTTSLSTRHGIKPLQQFNTASELFRLARICCDNIFFEYDKRLLYNIFLKFK